MKTSQKGCTSLLLLVQPKRASTTLLRTLMMKQIHVCIPVYTYIKYIYIYIPTLHVAVLLIADAYPSWPEISEASSEFLGLTTNLRHL